MSKRTPEEVAYVEKMMREARLAERERCAKIAEAADRDRHALSIFQGIEIAKLIREQ